MADQTGSTEAAGESVLVPVSDTLYARKTVAYAVDSYSDPRFVVVLSEHGDRAAAESLANRVRVWIDELTAGDEHPVEVYDTGRYLFSPVDYADVFEEYCRSYGVDNVLLDPEYQMDTASLVLEPLKAEIRERGLDVEVAPVERQTRRTSLLTRGGITRFAALSTMSFVFYLAVGEVGFFDVVTGAFAAVVVSTVLYKVSFDSTPRIKSFPLMLLRFSLYVPYLMWEIFKANLQIAYVTLHPSLPIDPEVVRFEARVWGGFPISTLANSITLTPGTLTVEADGRELHVHSLTASSKESLLDGDLERAVRFVFYGRHDQPPTPRQRGEEGDDG